MARMPTAHKNKLAVTMTLHSILFPELSSSILPFLFVAVRHGQAQIQIPLPTPGPGPQLKLQLGRERVCPPHTPLPVDNSYDLAECRREVAATREFKDPEADKRTPQIVLEHGYDLETHRMTTPDGYILTTYRVPGGKRSPSGAKKPAVLLYHASASVSDSWLVLPSDKNLVFKLVDAGFDVWLPNGRGTDGSRGHVRLDSEKDIAYWDFSFHEMGIYDVPSTVELILNKTGNDKLFYIGLSQGGTNLLVGASEVPELNSKIHASFLMAPAAYIGQAYMPSFTAFLPLLYTPVETLAYQAFGGRLETRNPQSFFNYLGLELTDVCSVRATQCDLCDNNFFIFADINPSQANYTNTPNLVKAINTANLKSYLHLGQNVLSCQFRKFDYGPARNQRVYGSSEPPSYSVGNITSPIHIFYGEQDSFVPPPDIGRLVSDLNPKVLHGLHRVDDDSFNHADFAVARDADKLVYDGLIEMINGYVGSSES